MRSTPFQSVLNLLASYLGEADGLSSEDAVLVMPKINTFVRMAWEYYWWPDVMNIELRTFRPAWAAGTAYAGPAIGAPVEVFFPTVQAGQYAWQQGAYYQALQPGTGHVPATLVGGAYQENGAYWALSCDSYSADVWATGTAYGVNNDGSGLAYQVQNPGDGQYYQCIQAHTAGTNFDPTKWGLLTPFVRSIALDPGTTSNQGPNATPIGEVRFIWDRDPEVLRGAQRIKFRVRNGYLQVLGTVPVVWVEFRTRPSNYVTTVLSGTTAYAAGLQVYDPATGDNWLTATATNAGDTPTSRPAKFTRVPFPYLFAEYVALSVYAALTNREEQSAGQPPVENFTLQQTAGFPLLLAELDKIERQQGQTRQMNVVSGRNAAGGWWYRG